MLQMKIHIKDGFFFQPPLPKAITSDSFVNAVQNKPFPDHLEQKAKHNDVKKTAGKMLEIVWRDNVQLYANI